MSAHRTIRSTSVDKFETISSRWSISAGGVTRSGLYCVGDMARAGGAHRQALIQRLAQVTSYRSSDSNHRQISTDSAVVRTSCAAGLQMRLATLAV